MCIKEVGSWLLANIMTSQYLIWICTPEHLETLKTHVCDLPGYLRTPALYHQSKENSTATMKSSVVAASKKCNY